MTKARFYIKDKVQEVGYRVHIMQKILNSDLKGNVLNLADGRVEVRLEGEKERIEEFYEELRKENTPNLSLEKKALPKKQQFYDLEFNADLMVPDSLRSSQALMLEQLSKGIVYIAGMNENIKGMNDKLDSLPERIAKELKAVLR
jgi:acylphosphatase